jgi:phenylpropionate dioxygenase-like ring-hydroxylating dioxygenase large terminal subunit
LSDAGVIERVFEHIDNGTTDLGDEPWREPTENYRSAARFEAELALMRRLPIVFCPSAALPEPGSYVARTAIGTPLVMVRGTDNQVRCFRNACRHRGMPVAQGNGCARALVCGYHGWTYRLDGALRHVPHAPGFPELDKSTHGLVPVHVVERGGLVFVTQDEPLLGDDTLDVIPELVTPRQQILSMSDDTQAVNWKLNMEGNLEGYHIKPTHGETFYPYGFDNLNVVEHFGNNNRVTFPFRRIEKLRDVPPEDRRIDGMVTFLNHLFPNVAVAVLSSHTSVTIAEPEAPDRTRFISYKMSNRDAEEGEQDHVRARRDADFVTASTKEDADVVMAIQESLASGANEHFIYGRFEKAIVHFHRTLGDLLGKMETANPS